MPLVEIFDLDNATLVLPGLKNFFTKNRLDISNILVEVGLFFSLSCYTHAFDKHTSQFPMCKELLSSVLD